MYCFLRPSPVFCHFVRLPARHVQRIGPALQEIAALKRSKEVLQREVARLQQQLSAAERDAQAAAAAAAAERARAARNASQRQNRLAAALHRLEGVTAREQQQATTLQEVCDARVQQQLPLACMPWWRMLNCSTA